MNNLHDDFDKNFKKTQKNIWTAFWVMLPIQLAVVGFVLWLLWKLVTHLTR